MNVPPFLSRVRCAALCWPQQSRAPASSPRPMHQLSPGNPSYRSPGCLSWEIPLAGSLATCPSAYFTNRSGCWTGPNKYHLLPPPSSLRTSHHRRNHHSPCLSDGKVVFIAYVCHLPTKWHSANCRRCFWPGCARTDIVSPNVMHSSISTVALRTVRPDPRESHVSGPPMNRNHGRTWPDSSTKAVL